MRQVRARGRGEAKAQMPRRVLCLCGSVGGDREMEATGEEGSVRSGGAYSPQDHILRGLHGCELHGAPPSNRLAPYSDNHETITGIAGAEPSERTFFSN